MYIFQLLKESAPACLTVAHFAELKDTKGIIMYCWLVSSISNAVEVMSPGQTEQYGHIVNFKLN